MDVGFAAIIVIIAIISAKTSTLADPPRLARTRQCLSRSLFRSLSPPTMTKGTKKPSESGGVQQEREMERNTDAREGEITPHDAWWPRRIGSRQLPLTSRYINAQFVH